MSDEIHLCTASPAWLQPIKDARSLAGTPYKVQFRMNRHPLKTLRTSIYPTSSFLLAMPLSVYSLNRLVIGLAFGRLPMVEDRPEVPSNCIAQPYDLTIFQ